MTSRRQENERPAKIDPLRSKIMRAVGRANTAPEMIVRRMLHQMGLRFRLHRKDLPGTPDIVLPKHRTVVFVHGCFWHRHNNCRKATTPKTRLDFWSDKFEKNVSRDRRNVGASKRYGWRVLTIWECETASPATLTAKLSKYFGQASWQDYKGRKTGGH